MKLLLVIAPALLLILLTPLIAEGKVFKAENYTVTYPNGCKIEDKENRYSAASRIECKGDAGFQFEDIDQAEFALYGLLSGGGNIGTLLGNDTDSIIDSMLSIQDSLWENVNEVERGADKYIVNGQPSPHLVVTYDQEFENLLFGTRTTKDFVALVVLVKISDDDYIVATYNNSEKNFDNYLPQAEKVIQSVKPVGGVVEELGNGTTVTETDNSFTSRGDDLPKTSALCDTVTTQSAKDLCETLLN